MNFRNQSLWMVEPGQPYPQLDHDLQVDVAVVGAGITGLTTAYLLAEAGIDVAVFEARTVGSGTTGHTTGKVTALQHNIYRRLASKFDAEEVRTYAAANVAGMNEIVRLVEGLGIDCDMEYRDNHTVAFADEHSDTLREEFEAAAQAGLDVEWLDTTELPLDVAAAIRLRRQVQLNAHTYCVGLARGVVESNGAVFEQTQVTDVDDQEDHFVLETSRGPTVRANWVVVATLLPFLDRGAFFAKTEPSQTYLLAYRTGDAPLFDHMYISVDEPVRTLRRAGEFTLVGGETQRVGERADTREAYAAIAKWAENLGLTDPVYGWSSHDYLPLDDVPYIGRMPRSRDNLLVATGFRKWGLTNGTAAALMLRDRVLGRANPWSELFDATRMDVANSAAEFVKDNAAVAKHFVGDRVSHPSRIDADEILPGQGGVARLDGKKLAIYRDDDGVLHRLSPRCPHMGCHLVWNTAEKTWDCPCHGSRFEATGAYIAGPAVKGMETE